VVLCAPLSADPPRSPLLELPAKTSGALQTRPHAPTDIALATGQELAVQAQAVPAAHLVAAFATPVSLLLMVITTLTLLWREGRNQHTIQHLQEEATQRTNKEQQRECQIRQLEATVQELERDNEKKADQLKAIGSVLQTAPIFDYPKKMMAADMRSWIAQAGMCAWIEDGDMRGSNQYMDSVEKQRISKEIKIAYWAAQEAKKRVLEQLQQEEGARVQ